MRKQKKWKQRKKKQPAGLSAKEMKSFRDWREKLTKGENDVLTFAPLRIGFEHYFAMTQVLSSIGLKWNEPFRIVIDYDPEQPRTLFRVYNREQTTECVSQ